MPDQVQLELPLNNPNRKFSPYAKGSVLAGLIGLAAATTVYTIVPTFEGVPDIGYLDPIGIPTKCAGDTTDVVVGKHYSAQECVDSLSKQLLIHARPVLACTPSIKDKPYVVSAAISFAYNIGSSAYCKSSIALYFNQGNYRQGCNAMMLYNRAGGKVLPGLVKRREEEIAICKTDMPGHD